MKTDYGKHVLYFLVAALPVVVEGDLSNVKTYLSAVLAGLIVVKALGSNPSKPA